MKDILGREEAVTVPDALRLLEKQELSPLRTEHVSLEDACGRVLAADVVAPEDLPGFDRSTMDGYAVYAADTFGASDRMPVYLEVRGQVMMGKASEFKLIRGQAAQIPTGGMLPGGADAVVMFEHTNSIDGRMIEVMKPVSPSENIIRSDEDVRKGETVLRGGRRLRPQDVGALAGLGITEVNVFCKPVVTIIGTGDEVVAVDRPLSPGQVRDINSYNLRGLIHACHATCVSRGIIRDNLVELERVVASAVEASDMVLITGGSSVGTRDYTAKVIAGLGSPGVLFHGVAMKPGKPLIAGIVNRVPVFGLPGHPAAVTVSFRTFVETLLLRLTGEREHQIRSRLQRVRALFSRNLSSSIGREEHVRVSIEQRNGALWAVPVLGKSGLVRTLVDADGIVIIPLNTSGIYEGEEVEVQLFK